MKLVVCIWLAQCLAALATDPPSEPYVYTTCEFDLGNDFKNYNTPPNYRPYPEEAYHDLCLSLYKNQEGDEATKKLRNTLLEESKVFGKYLSVLQKHDIAKSGKNECADNVYSEDTALRVRLHEKVKLWECYKEEDTTSFLKCMIKKRHKMIEMIPAH